MMMPDDRLGEDSGRFFHCFEHIHDRVGDPEFHFIFPFLYPIRNIQPVRMPRQDASFSAIHAHFQHVFTAVHVQE